jgi:hypothetical protein
LIEKRNSLEKNSLKKDSLGKEKKRKDKSKGFSSYRVRVNRRES